MPRRVTLSFSRCSIVLRKIASSLPTAASGAGLVIAALGCAPERVVESPLVDELHPPVVLVEGRELALPNTGPGNRFLKGWRYAGRTGELTIRPAASGARLEVVHLRARPRTLFFATRRGASALDVRAVVGPRGLETRTSLSGIEILLPADLHRGRNLIDLDLGDGADVAIVGATVSEAAKAGRVTIEGDDVIQQPWSLVDFVRRVEPDSVLVGEFVPPADAGDGQHFAVTVDRGSELETAVDIDPAGDTIAIRLALGDVSGLVRVRLVADGRGAAGRWRGLRIRRGGAAGSTTDSGPPAAPDIVVVYVLDALRADFLGHLGSEAGATPCIDRLAAEGAVFSNHFSVAPNTGPATTSLFTGFGFLRGRSIPAEVPTLAEAFAEAGYRTVSISSNPHLAPSFGLTRGFADVIFEPIDEDFRPGGVREPTVNDSAERVHRAALEWLDRVGPEDRAFLYIHTLNPHNPYTPPQPFPAMFLGPERSRIDGSTKTLDAIRRLELEVTPDDEQRIREWYTSGVAYNDAELCGFVDELARRFDGKVLLAVTSDHGEELFDHDGVLHGYTLYDELLHVPLVMWWPGRIPPNRFDGATDTLDLTETLRALIPGGPMEVTEGGRDLWAALGGGEEPGVEEGALHFATAPGLRRAAMARSNRWKLVLAPRPRLDWGMGKGRGRTHEAEYLFDLIDDPEERVNRAGTLSIEVDWLRSRLQGWLEYWEARQPEGGDEQLDEATRQRLEALGYAD